VIEEQKAAAAAAVAASIPHRFAAEGAPAEGACCRRCRARRWRSPLQAPRLPPAPRVCTGRRRSQSRHRPRSKTARGLPWPTLCCLRGLGNPGAQYALNRHNAGFIFADAIHAEYGFGPWRGKFEGLVCEGTLAGRKVHLLKPQTFMNDSGPQALARR